jgi:hypothetical protein
VGNHIAAAAAAADTDATRAPGRLSAACQRPTTVEAFVIFLEQSRTLMKV